MKSFPSLQRILLSFHCLLLAACASGSPTPPTQPPAIPQLTYEVSECTESTPPDMENIVVFTPIPGGMEFEQDISYTCCARIELSLEQSGDTLKVIETNTGEICRCICGYHISARITNLPPGLTRIQVWGIEYPDVHPLELRGEINLK